MKAILTIITLLFLAGCGAMHDMGRPSPPASSADFRDGFDPDNPYHGG